MATVDQSVTNTSESIATPITVILVGAVLALPEGVYDLFNANLYAGVVDGIEISVTEILLLTAIGMVLAAAILVYAYSVRYRPTKEAYLVLGVLSILTFVVGVFFTVAIVFVGAVIGFWEALGAPRN